MAAPESLSAKYTGSFAYLTIRDRLPEILSKVVDTVHRHKNKFFQEHGQEGVEAEKRVISFLSKLRNELQTDKPVIPLTDGLPDSELWNQYLQQQKALLGRNERPSWFKSPWLYVECYMYRRIHEAVKLNPPIGDFDVFNEGKTESFYKSQKAICALCIHLEELNGKMKDLHEEQLKEEFMKLLQISLWGNRCDLSISAGRDNSQKSSLLASLEGLKAFILVDDSKSVWSVLLESKKTKAEETSSTRVDIILDNAGFELVTDLVLADFLLASQLATEIHFHGKCMPWFVSDTTKEDFDWTLRVLQADNHFWMSNCGIKWEGLAKKGVWVYHEHSFWTLPHEFRDMAEVAPDLHAELQKSNLIFFKGDLNYRKLTGDRKWDLTTSFHQSLQGFHPAPLCSLRTLKADIQVGLQPGQGEQLTASDANWMTNGKYAIIQLSAST
ncbi:damage-control phosphatase ARMT1 isoform X2 [Latimeria chalumnae]|uniref:damage-control phosphatase ARMT1 isoform X2 n=1 Tax=Latimeria chalumnae TaxID=7897 RepID=UPI00313E151D